MILVTRPSMPPSEEYYKEISDIWDTRWLTNMGSKYRQFQAELEKMLDVPHAVLYCNGHLALENIIEAMDFPQGSEVITTPFTFASTTHAIVRCGLKPVFCDINAEDYTIDAAKLEALITDKTAAIIPVHVYGNICDVEAIKAIADKHSLKVIYDAAHAFSVRYKGRSSACFGDASMFSFHATKVFNTIEGGAVCFHDDKLVQKLNELKNFGLHGQEEAPYIGGNAKMNEFCAAMGICNLRHLDKEISKRRTVAERYRSHLENIAGIRLSPVRDDVEYNYAYFPVVFDEAVFGSNRDDIFTKLAENGIGARKYFYPLTNTFDCYKGMFNADNTPIALEISMRVLTLPHYADLSMDEVDRICEIILRCKK